MNGRSIGMFFGFGAGLRVGGELTFVPAHINGAGKKISHRVEVPVYCNSHRGNNGEGRSHLFRLVAWGDLARKIALSCPKGKGLDVLVELNAYKGRVYLAGSQQPVTGPDGQPIQITKTGLTISRIIFGEETQKFIDAEVQASARPVGWNNPASPDYQMWRDTLKARMQLQYTGGDRFGYARVIQPQGQILSPEQANSRDYTGQQAVVAAPAPAPQVAAVTAAFAPQTVAPTAAPVAPAAFAAPAAASAPATGAFVSPV